jgi:hypothetical protein
LPWRHRRRGFLAAGIGRALNAGLSFRPLEEAAVDTLAWVRERRAGPSRPEGNPLPPAGLSPERAAELLARLGG